MLHLAVALLLAAPAKAPDTSGVVAVMGRFATFHACPVTPHIALTAAHAADLRPFDPDIGKMSARWSSQGVEGLAAVRYVYNSADLLELEAETTPFPTWYPVAQDPPKEGSVVWFVGYNFDKKSKAYRPKFFIGKVLYVVAGHVIYDQAGEPGTSGCCLLNERGEVIGINVAGKSIGTSDEVGVGVGLWKPWIDPAKLQPKE
jgi:hypothetical protein